MADKSAIKTTSGNVNGKQMVSLNKAGGSQNVQKKTEILSSNDCYRIGNLSLQRYKFQETLHIYINSADAEMLSFLCCIQKE